MRVHSSCGTYILKVVNNIGTTKRTFRSSGINNAFLSTNIINKSGIFLMLSNLKNKLPSWVK
jgi:hypothetical protein